MAKRDAAQRQAEALNAFGKAGEQVLRGQILAVDQIDNKANIDTKDLFDAAELCRRMGHRQAAVVLQEFAEAVAR